MHVQLSAGRSKDRAWGSSTRKAIISLYMGHMHGLHTSQLSKDCYSHNYNVYYIIQCVHHVLSLC